MTYRCLLPVFLACITGIQSMHDMATCCNDAVGQGQEIDGWERGLESQAPAQDGPLSQYPNFSLVDEMQKWQRIQDWAVTDSAHAAADRQPKSPHHAPVSVRMDDAHSVGSTLLEMELARNSASHDPLVLAAMRAAATTAAAAAPAASLSVGAANSRSARAQLPSSSRSHQVDKVFAMLSSSAWAPPPAQAPAPTATSSAGLVAAANSSITRASHLGDALGGDSMASSAYVARPATTASQAAEVGEAISISPSRIPITLICVLSFKLCLPLVQRAALEGRALGAEDQLAASERRHALEAGRLRSRIEFLEQALEGERLLVTRAQQQLQAELLHVKGLMEAEAAARAAEESLRDRLERTKKVGVCSLGTVTLVSNHAISASYTLLYLAMINTP